jgi:hypothetical protein
VRVSANWGNDDYEPNANAAAIDDLA